MKKGLCTTFYILLTLTLFAGNNSSASYAYLSELFGIDDNSGLNSFLTLDYSGGGEI